jgi:hypothetical protein
LQLFDAAGCARAAISPPAARTYRSNPQFTAQPALPEACLYSCRVVELPRLIALSSEDIPKMSLVSTCLCCPTDRRTRHVIPPSSSGCWLLTGGVLPHSTP